MQAAITRARKHMKNDFFAAFVLTIVWQFALTLIGVFIYYVLVPTFHSTPFLFDRPTGIEGLFAHTTYWDGGWYQEVANHFYDLARSPAAAAFYPLFPLLLRIVRLASFDFLSYGAAGIIISTVSVWLAIAAFLHISRHLFKELPTRWIVIALLLAAPAGFFMHQLYTEALYIAIGSWAYYFALRRQWQWSALLIMVLSASRITFVLFAALISLEFLRSHAWKPLKALTDKQLAWLLLMPIGFLAYGLLLHIVRGDFFAMFHAYQHEWAYQKFDPNFILTILRAGKNGLQCLWGPCNVTDQLTNGLLPVVGIILTVAIALAGIFYLKKVYIPLGVMSLLGCIMFTLNSNVVSVHRYLLPLIGNYLILGAILEKRQLSWRWLIGPLLLSLGLQMALFCLFVNGYFAG